jgi:hypothetical protein
MKGQTGIGGKARRIIWLVIGAGMLLLLPLLHSAVAQPGFAEIDGRNAAPTRALFEPAIRLSAASGQTVLFKENNGRAIGGTEAETHERALLVLYRNGRLTAPDERTLVIELAGIEIPSPGVTVTLSVTTMHGDPDPGYNHGNPISIWHESRWIPADTTPAGTGAVTTFTHTFGELASEGAWTLATPTDYFSYDLTVTSPGGSDAEILYHWNENYAFLMENQWTAGLTTLQGAAGVPPGLIIHYCDMFPFRQDIRRPMTWIPRIEVTDFVGRQLVPGIQEIIQTEIEDWGFPWHPHWTSYRSDQDGELISIALTDGKTWFHSRAPASGHAGISINVNGGRAEYDQLVDGLMSTIYHELFHNLQRNIHQHQGGSGDVEGYQRQWGFFSVGQSRIQFGVQGSRRAYMAKAAAFLGSERMLGSDLNVSYRNIPASYAAFYWRFLYEQCGGMYGGIEDPAAGMGVIRRILESAYSVDIIDIASSIELVEALPAVIDSGLSDLATTACPFHTHRESLIAFSRAIYALRLQSGRCREPGLPPGCGFYDPNELYPRPPADVVSYAGSPVVHTETEQLYPAGIPSSYGIDFIEIELDPAVDGQSLTIEFLTDPAAAAELHAELGFLQATGPGRLPAMVGAFEPLSRSETDGLLSVTIRQIDMSRWDRLALIITRLDSAEAIDPDGAYSLVLRPSAGPG